jgi:hypothetical protein
MTIGTVYDPSEYPEEWTKDFTKRVCFCYARVENEEESEGEL